MESVREGDEVEVVLDRTPFYAEGGGQLADQGVVELSNGARLRIEDVQSPINGLIVHKATVINGEVTPGLEAHALVDLQRRLSISRAHTATHMVHKAFREALGETATQAGSENAPGRFRFDFSASGSVPASVMADVEARVNDVILDDLQVHAEVMSQAEAVRSGAMALFGEKYGDQVRVVSVGDWARELCGGTHAGSSGKLGVIKLLGESSIGSGVRRVEALVGADAYRFLAREHVLVAQLSEALKARPEELPERVNDIVEKLRAAEKELEKVRVGQLLARAGELAAGAEQVGGVALVATSAPGAGGGDVRTLALDVRGRLPQGQPGVVVVIGEADGKVSVVAATNDEARARGLSANELVRAVGPLVGGKGGGKDDVAQGGGTDASRLDEALRRGPQPRSPKRLRSGVACIGLDPGDARIGVARSDPTGFLATPVETVKRGRGDLARLVELLARGAGRRPGPGARGGRRAAPLALRDRGAGGREGARVGRAAGPRRGPGAGAAGRRAAHHRERGGYAARPWAFRGQAPGRGRPGRSRGDPPARPGHRESQRHRAGRDHRGDRVDRERHGRPPRRAASDPAPADGGPSASAAAARAA